MKNKDNNRFIAFITKHRIFTLTIILFLIVLPLILIPTVYITQVASAKHVIFEDKSIKAVSVDKQDYFDIEFSLYSITEPTKDSKGKYSFNYSISLKEGLSESKIKNISFNGQLSVVNDKYTVFNKKFTEVLESTNRTKFDFTWEYNMNKSILPFLKPQGPTLYLQIFFTEQMVSPIGEEVERVIYVKVPYN